MPPRILAFGGSLRRDSFNHKLVTVAARGAEAAGAEVTLVRLADFPMPVYDGDLEASDGLPAEALRFKDLMKAHQGLLISSPEYNSSMSAALKNAIDWASRPVEGERPLECFDGKVASLMAASPGALGGLRGLVHLRSVLSNIKVIVLPDQRAVSQAHTRFDEGGGLGDAELREQVEGLGRGLAEILARLQG